jgi:transcriptional regulator with XRE-family HTH domain
VHSPENRIRIANSGHRPKHNNAVFLKLREVRIAKGISQKTLASMIGCSINDINRYERRFHLPSADTFVAWLQALDFKIVPPELDYASELTPQTRP